MKTSSAILFIVLVFFNFQTNATPTATIAHVHFSKNPTLQQTLISNMKTIEHIWTAGHYAWAVGENRIAFYDGNTWRSAEEFSDWNEVINFSPLYPVRGERPNAIITAKDHNHALIIQIFDGMNWHAPLTAHQLLNLPKQTDSETCQIQTARGFAYLLCQIEDDLPEAYFTYAIYNSKTDTWSTPHTIQGVYGSYVKTADINNENAKLYLLLATRELYTGDTLIEIAPDGSYTKNELNPMTGNEINVTDSHVFISYWDYLNQSGLIGKNVDPSAQLQSYPLPPFDNNGYLEGYYSNGFIYLFNIDPYNANNTVLSLVTLNSTKSNPTWNTALVLESDWHALDIKFKENGAWLGINLDTYNTFAVIPKILNYNAKTNSFADTGFPMNTTHLLRAQMLSVNPNQLLVCLNKNDDPLILSKIYYYQDNLSVHQWLEFETNSYPISNCHFSTSGTGEHPVFEINREFADNVWIYDQPRPQKSIS